MLLQLVLAAMIGTGDGAAPASESALVRLDHQIMIAAPPEAVWNALTTPEGLRWIAPEARVERRPGGAYELLFSPDDPSDRGMEGTRVLALVPNEMLANSGELPGTWVVWRLEVEGERTHLRVTSMGTGPQWAERAAYFDAAMPDLLQRLARSVEGQSAH